MVQEQILHSLANSVGSPLASSVSPAQDQNNPTSMDLAESTSIQPSPQLCSRINNSSTMNQPIQSNVPPNYLNTSQPSSSTTENIYHSSNIITSNTVFPTVSSILLYSTNEHN